MNRYVNGPAETLARQRAAVQRREPDSRRLLNSASNQVLLLQQTIGNRAVRRLVDNLNRQPAREYDGVNEKVGVSRSDSSKQQPDGIGYPPRRVEPQTELFATVSEFSSAGARQPLLAPSRKRVEEEEQLRDVHLMMKNGDGGVAPATKEAGVDSFSVKWKKHPGAGPGVAKLRLDYAARFTKDATHDPALAEFRQNAGDNWEITDGPHKGSKGTSALADDNYSRADDTGHAKTDVDFVSNDNPGWDTWIDKDDVLDYSFTAEQMIIDTSRTNKVIAKRGPHTGTIKGKHPRTYGGVPKDLTS